MTTHKPGDRVYIAFPPAGNPFAATVERTGSLAWLTNGQIPVGSDRGATHGIEIRHDDDQPNSIHCPSHVFKTPDEAAVAMLGFLTAWGEGIKAWLEAERGKGTDASVVDGVPAQPPGPVLIDYDPAELKLAQASFDRTVRGLRVTDN